MQSSVSVSFFQASDWGLVQPREGVSVFEPSREALELVEKHHLAVTIRNREGQPVAYLGMRPLGSRRAEAWAIIDCRRTLREFAEIHDVAKKYVDTWDADRIEAFVECGFAAGHLWLKRLGFEMEAPRMRRYLPDGKDCALYARVRDGGGHWVSPK